MTKNKFHREARNLLKHIAADHLNLSSNEYDCRTNFGGPAVLGESILHTNHVYVQIGGLNPNQVLVRSVLHRKDYTGGQNHFVSLDQKQKLVELIKRLSANPVHQDWAHRLAVGV